jgi:hypothetical protein
MNPKTIQTIVEMLKIDGEVEDGLLDDLVHDTASEIASAVNNEGVEDQVAFLLGANWSGEDILFKVKELREEEA